LRLSKLSTHYVRVVIVYDDVRCCFAGKMKNHDNNDNQDNNDNNDNCLLLLLVVDCCLKTAAVYSCMYTRFTLCEMPVRIS